MDGQKNPPDFTPADHPECVTVAPQTEGIEPKTKATFSRDETFIVVFTFAKERRFTPVAARASISGSQFLITFKIAVRKACSKRRSPTIKSRVSKIRFVSTQRFSASLPCRSRSLAGILE